MAGVSPSFAVGTRTKGMLPASTITLISCCVSRQVSALCCILIQMKSWPSHAFFAAARSGSMMVLLKTCFPSFSLVMTVLNVCDPALMVAAAGCAGCAEMLEAAANNAADNTIPQYEERARKLISVPAWEYYDQGCADDLTVRWNPEAL